MDSKQTLQQLYQLFNQRDLDSAVRLFSDTAEMVNVTTGEKFVGKDDLRRFLEGWIQAFPDIKVQNPSIGGGEDRVVGEFVAGGTHKGPLVGPKGSIPATGRKVEMRFCDVWDVKNGKLEFGRVYYDGVTMMAELGITGLPAVEQQDLKPVELRPH